MKHLSNLELEQFRDYAMRAAYGTTLDGRPVTSTERQLAASVVALQAFRLADREARRRALVVVAGGAA